MGLIPTRWDLMLASKISASSFCRRRLPVVMVRSMYRIIIWEGLEYAYIQRGEREGGGKKTPLKLLSLYIIFSIFSII